MKAAVTLLLHLVVLLCVSGPVVQGDHGLSDNPEVWTEFLGTLHDWNDALERKMDAMTQNNTALEERIKDLNTELERMIQGNNTALEKKIQGNNTALDKKMRNLNTVLEKKIKTMNETVTKNNTELRENMSNMRETLASVLQNDLQVVRRANEDMQEEVTDLKRFKDDFQADVLSLTGAQEELLDKLGKLQSENKERKVAFSVALGTHALGANFGPYPGPLDQTLIYSNIVTNIGGHYDLFTGVFTAPVKGLYLFTFTAHNRAKPRQTMAVKLVKNGVSLMHNAVSLDGSGTRRYISNALAVELVVGDKVEMKLRVNTGLFDDLEKQNTFTGCLLFSTA